MTGFPPVLYVPDLPPIMTESRYFTTQRYEMDLESSIAYDKESMLEAMVEASGLTPEEFVVDYIIEEHPIEIITIDDILRDDHTFSVRQTFRVRLRTEDEKQLAIESKEKNVDPN